MGGVAHSLTKKMLPCQWLSFLILKYLGTAAHVVETRSSAVTSTCTERSGACFVIFRFDERTRVGRTNLSITVCNGKSFVQE